MLRDVEVSENQTRVLIHGKGKKELIVYLDEKTTVLVLQYLEEYHPDRRLSLPFFYTESHGQRHPMSVRNYEKLIKKYADKARADNHPLPDSVSPHTFRRTRGTNLYRDGVDISVVSGSSGSQRPSLPSVQLLYCSWILLFSDFCYHPDCRIYPRSKIIRI